MKILVGAASKHGATREVAERIAARLRRHGHLAELHALGVDDDVSEHDAFVIGSAVYMDAWRKEARAFVDTHLDVLRTRPVWLFSSGPLGGDADGSVPPDNTEHLATEVEAIDHHVFGGRLDRSDLGPGERLLAAVVHAPEGDFRPWTEIDEWADGIAESLSTAELTR